MGLKEQLLDALEALAPQIDRTKALLELDASASAISHILSEPQGLDLVEYIIEELECGNGAIYASDKFLERTRFDQLIEHFYTSQQQQILDVLLQLYHQLWVGKAQNADTAREKYAALKKLESSVAASTMTVLNICLNCYSNLDETSTQRNAECSNCKNEELLKVHKLVMGPNAKAVLKNGQFLEIYVKECLRNSGIELIGWETDKGGPRAFTSIKYQVEGELIDVDVHGVSQPLAILLCEVKTSKIIMNELRRVEELLNRLINRLNEQSGGQFNHLKLFVTTQEFDQNISIAAYRRKRWELLDRTTVPSLTEAFRRIQTEL